MGKVRAQLGRAICITLMARIGAYHLEDLDENVVPRPWNVNNLRRTLVMPGFSNHIPWVNLYVELSF